MAKYTPAGWQMSREGAQKFQAMLTRVNMIVKKRVNKYNLASMDKDDLMQEGRLAAAYAVDTYEASRGNLDGYIARVVSNALAMVAAEALAQARQPYKTIQESDGTWRKVPVGHVEIEHETATDPHQCDSPALARDEAIRLNKMTIAMESKLSALRLSLDARELLRARLQTPAELWIMARNLNRGRLKLEANSVCRYLGWSCNGQPDRQRYQRAARELRDQFRYVLGVDDQTFEPIPARPIPTELYTGGKVRVMEVSSRKVIEVATA